MAFLDSTVKYRDHGGIPWPRRY